MTEFSEFSLDASILKALEKVDYKTATPVQAVAIPHILAGRDIIALAQTGSGKTAACSIPICQKVDLNKSGIQALVLVPTRELALQYSAEVQKVGAVKGVKVFAVIGGEDASLQRAKLNSGVHVLIATPGRLIDFIYNRSISLNAVETVILDEADEMLSMGFYDDLEFIIQCLIHEHQTLLFSATMPKAITKLAKLHMKDPEELVLERKDDSLGQIDHRFLYCTHTRRTIDLKEMLEDLNPTQAIIFCHSRIQVEQVARELKREFGDTDYLHAGMAQNLRQVVTNKFRQGKFRFLVATDVASRGLDFSNVSHVFIYQLSDDPCLYVHRAGRTGRYNKKGMVITLVTKRELSSLNKVMALLKQDPVWISEPPSSQERASSSPPRRKGRSRKR